MHDPKKSVETAIGAANPSAREVELRARFEQLRALRSAWGALAPSGLSSEKQTIAETGRELSEDLTALLSAAPSSTDRATIANLDAGLAKLEREMREVAFKVPVAQLRSTLPERVVADRRGLLDLLDLLLGAEIAGLDGTSERIPVFDYLITLLCAGGDGDAPLQDPVTLTPRLHGLCERSDVDYDPRLPELEAEFFSAANLHEGEIREEIELRTLRRRKAELGSSFFAPGVLRAIMTYNTALLQRIDEEVLSSQDWGVVPASETLAESVSVFETSALPSLAGSLRRRAAGDPPAHDPFDHVAWCLDFASLTRPEREALLSESTGRRENLKGTTILVGLLCRSAVVLDEEFPAIGIDPAQLSGAWLEELGDALQQEVNRHIVNDDYDGACVFSDLKGKFLASKTGDRKPRPPRTGPPPPVRAGFEPSSKQQARQMASEALESLPRRKAQAGLLDLRWGRIVRTSAAVLLTAVAVLLLANLFWASGRLDRSELARVSPLLSSGKRSADGVGPAFVGTLQEEWSRLDAAEQSLAADELVEALRARGVRQVMVYDGDDRLRIQALGGQSARVISLR